MMDCAPRYYYMSSLAWRTPCLLRAALRIRWVGEDVANWPLMGDRTLSYESMPHEAYRAVILTV